MSWNASHTGGCVGGHLAVVMAILQSGCSTRPVVSVAHEGFLWLDLCKNWWGELFVRLVGWFSNSACDFLWWSTGVVLYNSIPRYGSSRSSPHLHNMFLTVCTMRSANPFNWGYNGELVMCSIPYASVNWWNSRQLYCGPLSVMSWEGIPCLAKMLFIWFIMARELVPASFLMIGNLL